MSETQTGSAGKNMTAEQRAKMKNFGKKNGLSEQKVNEQLSPSGVVASSPAFRVQNTPTPTQVIQPPTQQNVVQQEKEVYQEPQTFFSYQENDVVRLEVDLITFREKGIETRYLSLKCVGYDLNTDPPTPHETFLNIGSKEDFEKLKSFFIQLEWED